MIKSGVVLAAVALAGLFVYFYAAQPAEISSSDKAKQAAREVGDAFRDTGVAGLVDVRLKTKFGIDATRFLHTYYDNGHIILYGLVPGSIDQQTLHDEAAKVPGVIDVQLLLQPRPASIKALPSLTGGQSASPAEQSGP